MSMKFPDMTQVRPASLAWSWRKIPSYQVVHGRQATAGGIQFAVHCVTRTCEPVKPITAIKLRCKTIEVLWVVVLWAWGSDLFWLAELPVAKLENRTPFPRRIGWRTPGNQVAWVLSVLKIVHSSPTDLVWPLPTCPFSPQSSCHPCLSFPMKQKPLSVQVFWNSCRCNSVLE